MKLTPRTVVPALAALAALLAVIGIGVAITGSDDDQEASGPPTVAVDGPPTTADGGPSTVSAPPSSNTSTSSTTTTVVPSTTGPPPPPEAGDDRYDPVDTDLTKVDRSDPENVVKAWCAYYTREAGQSAQDWADQLAPISSVSLYEALSDLNFGGEDPYSRDSAFASLEPLNGDRWIAVCLQRSLRPDGAPISAPLPARQIISLYQDDDGGWAVGAADIGGYVIPEGVGQE